MRTAFVMMPVDMRPRRGKWWRAVEDTSPYVHTILEHIHETTDKWVHDGPSFAIRQSDRESFEALCHAHNLQPEFLEEDGLTKKD